jgi:hypothetical protein
MSQVITTLKQLAPSIDKNILILSKNSIEDYLLNATAIKKAFPNLLMTNEQISEFLEQNNTRRNKKSVLDSLLQRSGTGKYDEYSARRIAMHFDTSQIDDEISRFFSLISSFKAN